MQNKILLLGHTGKMGTALNDVLKREYEVIGKNSADFNAEDPGQIRAIIEETRPGIVINTVAMGGIDACEQDPARALTVNTLFPKALAEFSVRYKFFLVHFSTDAVFADRQEGYYTEDDPAYPVNMYGLTKYGGDCFVRSLAPSYYIIRTSVLFGASARRTQFIEKMLERVRSGARTLKIADDIIATPTGSLDVAVEISRMLREKCPPGLYHVVNTGRASLWELMKAVAGNLDLDVVVEKASYKDFPFIGRKNTCTPIRSARLPALRPWQDAARDYCGSLKGG